MGFGLQPTQDGASLSFGAPSFFNRRANHLFENGFAKLVMEVIRCLLWKLGFFLCTGRSSGNTSSLRGSKSWSPVCFFGPPFGSDHKYPEASHTHTDNKTRRRLQDVAERESRKHAPTRTHTRKPTVQGAGATRQDAAGSGPEIWPGWGFGVYWVWLK